MYKQVTNTPRYMDRVGTGHQYFSLLTTCKPGTSNLCRYGEYWKSSTPNPIPHIHNILGKNHYGREASFFHVFMMLDVVMSFKSHIHYVFIHKVLNLEVCLIWKVCSLSAKTCVPYLEYLYFFGRSVPMPTDLCNMTQAQLINDICDNGVCKNYYKKSAKQPKHHLYL